MTFFKLLVASIASFDSTLLKIIALELKFWYSVEEK